MKTLVRNSLSMKYGNFQIWILLIISSWKNTYAMFPDTNCLFVTFQILWPLNTMNCGVLRPQIASLWSMVTRLSVLDLVKIGRGYWLYLHERIHMQYVSRHKLSLCDLSNIVSFWHNELWCPPTTNKLSVTFYPSNSTQKYCPNLLFFDEIKKIVLINIFWISGTQKIKLIKRNVGKILNSRFE